MKISSVVIIIFCFARVSAQCPEITNTTTNPNCIPECTRCGGDQITINIQGGDLPHNGKIDYYADVNPGFNPYIGQGTLIGSANITTNNPKCRICPSLLGFMIDACGTEAANEFLIMWSGSGLNTSDFYFDYAPQNNTGGAGNADIGPGGCGIGAGPAGLVGGCTAISVGANFNIPPNSIWIVFTSANAFTSYDFSAICGLSCKIYVSASNCTRTIGAFSNFDASPGSRTQVMTITGCGCSTNASYDIPGLLTGNGDFWAEGSISNNGCAVPSLSPPAYTAATSIVTPFNYTIPQSWCERDYEIVGIPNPAPDPDCCMPIYTERILVHVKCPVANTSTLEACEIINGLAAFTLEDADPDVLGSSNGLVEYYRDKAGTQRIFSPFTSGNATIYARIIDGNCKSNVVAIQLKVNPLPVAKATSDKQCDDGSGFANFDLSLLETTIKNGNNGATVKFFEDINKTKEISSPYQTGTTTIYACIHNGKCESAPVAIFLTVLPKPIATSVTSSACPGADGKAVFLLLDLITKITNNPSGTSVNFYEDDLLLKKINPPYSTPGDTIYAVVTEGNCKSEPVEIILKVSDLNTVLLITDKICDDGNGSAVYHLIPATRYLQQGDTSIRVSWYRDSLKLDTVISPVTVNQIDTFYAFLKKDSCISKAIPVIIETVKRPVGIERTYEFCGGIDGQVIIPLNTLENGVKPFPHLPNMVLFATDSNMTQLVQNQITTSGDTLYAVILDSPCNSLPVKVIINVNPSPFFDPYPDQVYCDHYLLPALSGTNLSPNASYFNSMGKPLQESDTIRSSQWIYVSDTLGICSDLDSFYVDILKQPEAGPDNNISVCEGTVLNLNNLLSNHDGGGIFVDIDMSGSLQDSLFTSTGHNGQTFRFQYILNGNSYCQGDTAVFTVQVVKQLFAGQNPFIIMCENEQLSLLNATLNGDAGGIFIDPINTGALQQLIWDARISGPGTFDVIYQVGDGITCPTDTALIKIQVLPNIEIDKPQDVSTCGYYVLPDISGKNTIGNSSYFIRQNGILIPYKEGDTLFSSTIINIVGIGQMLCPDSDSFQLEILNEVNSDFKLTDVCPDFSIDIGTTTFNLQNSNGKVIFKNGSFTGCDSIVQVDLSFLPVAQGNYQATLCESKSLMLGNTTFDRANPSGTAVLKNQSAHGCDSFVQVSLLFESIQMDTFRTSLCEGERIQIRNKFYDAQNLSGIDTLTNINPDLCDSIVVIEITALKGGVFNYNVTLCENDSLVIGSIVFNKNFTGLHDTIQNGASNFCDSIRHIQINFSPLPVHNYTDTLCENEFRVIQNNRYDSFNPTGTEIFKGAGFTGCDSIVHIQLYFLKAVQSQYSPALCENDSIDIHGNYYSKYKTFGLDTLKGQASGGCDSIVSISVQLIPLATGVLDTPLCENQQIVLNGKIYDKNRTSGIELYKGAAVTGCDSLVQINLKILPQAVSEIKDTLCEDEQLIINGNIYNKKNPSGQSIIPVAGSCDSLVNVDLYFNSLQVIYPSEVKIFQGSGQSIQLQPNFTPVFIQWFPTQGLSCTDCLNPVITVNADTEYSVTLLDENGCEIVIRILMKVFLDDQVFVPNVFSPNGDNINDVFKLMGENKLINIRSFVIYDRWGNLIYSEPKTTLANHKGWDGSALNGDKMNPGVYIFSIEIENQGNQFRKIFGDITLMR